MRPVDHFLSQLEKATRHGASPDDSRLSPDPQEFITREFVSLTAPVIGEMEARDLCDAFLDRVRATNPPAYIKLGYAAAFLLGEFDDTMELSADEWEDIRDTLEDTAGEMNLDTLTTLMGELLSRGKLR
jgi:hypothetical protein